jgi:enolase
LDSQKQNKETFSTLQDASALIKKSLVLINDYLAVENKFQEDSYEKQMEQVKGLEEQIQILNQQIIESDQKLKRLRLINQIEEKIKLLKEAVARCDFKCGMKEYSAIVIIVFYL